MLPGEQQKGPFLGAVEEGNMWLREGEWWELALPWGGEALGEPCCRVMVSCGNEGLLS